MDFRAEIAPDKAAFAEHNGYIWSRKPTQYGTISAGRTVRFLLGDSINQLERSATSIGANVREANYAHSRADFVSKLQIALKECYETEYWLELLQRAKLASAEDVSPLLHDCGSLRRLLVSSVNTAKKNQSSD